MLRTTLIGTCVLMTTASFAAPRKKCQTQTNGAGQTHKVCYEYVSEERVLQNIKVEPTNAGINPEHVAYLVSGDIELAGNACLAQGLKPTLKFEKHAKGINYLVARAEGWRRTDIFCTMVYDPIMKRVSTTVRGEQELAASTFIKHAEEFNNAVPLEDYLP